MLLFSLHHVVFAFGAAGMLGAVATPGGVGAPIAATGLAAFAVWRSLTCALRVDDETVVVRNRWRTYRVRRADVARMRPGELHVLPPSPSLIVLELTGQGRRRLRVHATVSPSREVREAAVRSLTARGIVGHRMREYVEAWIA